MESNGSVTATTTTSLNFHTVTFATCRFGLSWNKMIHFLLTSAGCWVCNLHWIISKSSLQMFLLPFYRTSNCPMEQSSNGAKNIHHDLISVEAKFRHNSEVGESADSGGMQPAFCALVGDGFDEWISHVLPPSPPPISRDMTLFLLPKCWRAFLCRSVRGDSYAGNFICISYLLKSSGCMETVTFSCGQLRK